MEIPQCRVAIFASGAGSNAKNFCHYFKDHPHVHISLLLTNNGESGVPAIAGEYGIPYLVFNREEFFTSDKVLQRLLSHEITLIILAGFLWLVPTQIISIYEDRIINIHPALLPKYGGKGMYGMNVHKAVIEHHEKKSGITIHLVNEYYDKGKILAQYEINVDGSDTPELLAQKIHHLEHTYFPKVVEHYALNII